MKIKLLIIAFCLCNILACTQYTCPTYTKDEVKKTEKTEKEV